MLIPLLDSVSFAGQRAIWAHGEVEFFGSACTRNWQVRFKFHSFVHMPTAEIHPHQYVALPNDHHFICCCRAAKYIHRSGLFSFVFTLSYEKMIANGHMDLLEQDSTFLKDPGMYVTVSNMHSFMNPSRWTVDHQHHNTKSKWMTVLTPLLLHGCSYLLQSSKHFLQYLLSDKCEELLASKKQRGIRDTRMFLVKGQLRDWCRLSKDFFSSFNTTENIFSVNVASFIFSRGHLKLELVMSYLSLFFFVFLREITAERRRNGER